MSRTKEQLNQRVLHLLNRATKPEELTYPKHYRDGRRIEGLPKTTAEALLKRRDKQARRAFSNIKDVELLSDDQLQTLRDAMDVPAAEFFRENMAEEVLPGNWELDNFSATFEDRAAFSDIVDIRCNFVDFIASQVQQFGTERFGNSTAAELAGELIKRTYIEHFPDPHFGSYAFAFWFYQFDADNWFTFDHVRETTEQYLNYYASWDDRLEFFLFKGFDEAGVLANAVSHADLPVVVNYGEQAVTIWTSQLLD